MAILFGVLAIIGGLLLPMLFGWVGFAIPVAFGVLAIIFTILKNKKRKEQGLPRSIGGLVCGIIGIVLAALLIGGLNIAVGKIRNEMEKYGVSHFRILDKSIDSLGTGGIIGMISAAKDEIGENYDMLKDEFNLLQDYMKGVISENSTPATEAAGGEGATAAAGDAQGSSEEGAAEGGEADGGEAEGGEAGYEEGGEESDITGGDESGPQE